MFTSHLHFLFGKSSALNLLPILKRCSCFVLNFKGSFTLYGNPLFTVDIASTFLVSLFLKFQFYFCFKTFTNTTLILDVCSGIIL